MPEGRLLVVSNRLPLTLRREGEDWRTERSAGGLATAMDPILRRIGGLWLGWPGDTVDGEDPKRREQLDSWEREGAIAIDLPSGLAERYYQGYANQTLWPLFHSFPSHLKFDPESWTAYVEGNRAFCRAVVERARPEDVIWVHDYHLMLLPRMLRDALPEARIGFFLHIPFPNSDVFAVLPRREEVLDGLLGADLVAFQTHMHLQSFRSSLLRLLGVESRIGEVVSGGRPVRLEALPIGIAPENFTSPDTDADQQYEGLRKNFEGLRVLLAVDRLDYTKGLPERLRAYRRMLRTNPDLQGKVVLIQVAVPSREGIETYQDLRSEVNETISDINGKLGSAAWTPVVYINRGIQRAELRALYRLADVGWVAPLRDGMNLVAKEYAASKPAGNGVLVLSEFAGAAAEMGEALLVNPVDEERTAETVERALRLDPEERRDRMRALHERVVRNDVFAWGERFLGALREAARVRIARPHSGPEPLDIAAAAKAYRSASSRLVVLDYDGTLVNFAGVPHRAAPPADLLRTLARLAGERRNVVAVVSGRRAKDLERWLGGVHGLWLAAEHGAMLRGRAGWESLRPEATATGWKEKVRPILDHFMDRTPGSFVEEKEYALVWHYRMAEPEFGEWLANELAAMLESMLAETELRAFRGNKIVEVRPIWADKGQLLDRLSAMAPNAGFRFAAGDDRTDEDVFVRMGPQDWTVHVGEGDSRARFTLPDPASVRRLLESFS